MFIACNFNLSLNKHISDNCCRPRILHQCCWSGGRGRQCGCTAGSGRTGGSAGGGRLEEEESSQESAVEHPCSVSGV